MQVEAIEKHYIANRQKLHKRMSFRAGSPEAGEDVVQTAYERAIRYRRSCDPQRFDQWFSMLLNNALRDYKREEMGHSSWDAEDEEATDTNCPHYSERILKEILDLVETKSVDQVEVLTLHFKNGYNAIDICHITDYSYAKTHQIIQRFRNELKDLYSE